MISTFVPFFFIRSVFGYWHKLIWYYYSVPVLTICGLVSLNDLFHSTPVDQSWNAAMPAVWSQLVQSTSIVCTCIPSLKRVLADLQTGMMAGTVSDFFELSVSGGGVTQYGSGSNSKSRSGYVAGSVLGSVNNDSRVAAEDRSPPRTTTFSNKQMDRSESLRNLRDNDIVQTTEIELNYSGSPEPDRSSSGSHDMASYRDVWTAHHTDRTESHRF
jgi:hypothetical protein